LMIVGKNIRVATLGFFYHQTNKLLKGWNSSKSVIGFQSWSMILILWFLLLFVKLNLYKLELEFCKVRNPKTICMSSLLNENYECQCL
jgi:hypothetical protein